MNPFESMNDRAFAAQGFLGATQGQGTPFVGFDGGQMGGQIPGIGPLMNMIVQPQLSSFLQNNGMFPGMFNGNGSILDMMRAEEHMRNRMQAAALAAQTTDTRTWLQTAGGLAQMVGAPFGLEQQAAMARSYRSMAPMLSLAGSVAPTLVDALHGSKGSAAIMTQNMFHGAQYRLDAISGTQGMTPDALKQLTDTVEQNLYGTPAKVAEMRGIGMGQLGGIFDESARRGYLPSSLSVRSRDAQLEALAKHEGVDASVYKSMDNAAVDDKLRQFDTQRVSSRLKDMAGSVSAMRELFGSMGQQDAPMAQIMNALEAITQNKLATMPPARVEQIVRQTKAVMESTGMGLDAIQDLIAGSANYGDQMGLDRSLAVQSGQGAALFGNAYKNSFGSSFNMFGASSVDVLMKKDALLRQNAAGSQQAQYAGAVIRSVEALGIGSNTEMGKLAEALRSGATEFNGQSMYDILRKDKIAEIMGRSNLSNEQQAAVNAAMSDKFGNQEYIERHDLGNTIRRVQGKELIDRVGRQAGEQAVSSILRAGGASAEDARKMGQAVGGSLLNAFLQTEDPEKLSTVEGRREIVEKALQKTMSRADAAKYADSIALSFESEMTDHARVAGYDNLPQMLQAHNTTILQQRERNKRATDTEAQLASELAPLGKSGPIQRVMDMLQSNPDLKEADILKVVGTALGGIHVEDVKKLRENIETVRTLRNKENLSDEEKEKLDASEKSMKEQVDAMMIIGQKEGTEAGRRISNDDFARVSEGNAELDELLKGKPEGMSDEKYKAEVERLTTRQLKRMHNMTQALYVDEGTQRKLTGAANDGKLDGWESATLIKSTEANELHLLRITNGDASLIARALRNDPEMDQELAKQIRNDYAILTKQHETLNQGVLSDSRGASDRDFELSKQAIDKVRKERMMSDDEQTDDLRKRIAALGNMSEEDIDREQFKKMIGNVGDNKRNDMFAAVARAERARSALESSGLTEEEYYRRYYTDAELAGSLRGFGAGGKKEDAAELMGRLESFAPEPTKPASTEDKQETSSTTEYGQKGPYKVEITGTLTTNPDGTSSLAGFGYTTLPVG